MEVEFWLFNFKEIKRALQELAEYYNFSFSSMPITQKISDKTAIIATDPIFSEMADKIRHLEKIRSTLDNRAKQLIDNVYINKRWTDKEAMRKLYMSPATYYRFRASILDKFIL